MPPQNNQVPPVPPVPPSPQQSGPGFSVDSLQKNKKFMVTLKTFAVYGTIMYVINIAVGMVVSLFHFSRYYNPLSVTVLIMAIIAGIIGFAIGAAIFYFLYDPVHNWVKRTPFLSKYIHDMFTLFWKPFIVITIISAAFGLLGMLGLGAVAVGVAGGYGAASFGGMFIGWIVGLVINVGVYYWYAKTVSVKLAPYYPW